MVRCVTAVGGILLLLVVSVHPIGVAKAPPGETITLALKAPPYQLGPLADGLTALDAEGCGVTGRPGQSLLPHQAIDVALPPDVAWDSLELAVRHVQTATVPGTYRLRTAEPYRPSSGQTHPTADPAPAAEPPPIARIAATGQMRKWRVARVDFVPFRYDPASGQLRVVEQATVEIRFTRTNQPLSADALADTVMDDVAAAQFANYAAAQAWYPRASRPQNVLWDYVIVTTSEIRANSSELDAFVAHKQALGHHVWVATETSYGTVTGQAPNGRAEKVRQWLTDNYLLYGFKYVLMIGEPTPGGSSATDVPMKMCWPRSTQPDAQQAPTDYFYADLTGNWNLDGDQLYGEYVGDWGLPGGVDLFPELYVGRIPFYGDYADLDHILQKTMDYQTEDDIAWRNSILLPMSFMAADYDSAPMAEQMWDDYLSAAGYTRWRMYQQGNATCNPDSIYPSDEELRAGTLVRDRWAGDDYGIVTWWAHGCAHWASVGYPGCWDAIQYKGIEGILFHYDQAAALDDAHPSFTYQCSCGTGKPEEPDNLAYAILRQGGIATVGASRVSWNGPVKYGDFDHSDGNAGIGYAYVQRLVNGYSASEALCQAKFISAAHIVGDGGLMNSYVFNLYGDPAVRITDGAVTGRSHLSIPAAAFQPAVDGYDFENHGRFLIDRTGGTGTHLYLAPVDLPHGATITSVTFQWNDRDVGRDGTARLKRTNRTGGFVPMAEATTFAEGGYGSSRDPSVTDPVVDNVGSAYWLEWEIPAGTPDVWHCNAVIEYIPPPAANIGYLSIPAAAFRPFEDGYDFENAGLWLVHHHGPGGGSTRGWYVAPVHLPDGATVTRMRFYYWDNHPTEDILARMQYSNLAGSFSEMAYADSSGTTTGYASKSDDTIVSPVIDNARNSYWVIWDGPVYGGAGQNASGVGVLIEYGNPHLPSGHYSLPAAAFTPFSDDWLYTNHARYLIHEDGGSRAHYEAPVYLPQGARIVRVTFWFNDDSAVDSGWAHLCRTDRAGNYSYMASIESNYQGGFHQQAEPTVDDPVIDNARYAYWAYWDLPVSTGPGQNVWGTGITIDYTVWTVYLPLLTR